MESGGKHRSDTTQKRLDRIATAKLRAVECPKFKNLE
jgi:hypothetical protein